MLRILLRTLTLLTLLLYLGVAAQAAIIRVPQDQPGFQAALDAAAAGDTIELADGTHSGSRWGMNAVSLRSATGNPAACIVIDSGIYLNLYGSPAYNITISGITFKGYSGFYISGAGGNITATHCVFEDARVNRFGLEINDENATLTVTRCAFKNYNDVDVYGYGAIGGSVRTLSVSDCTFTNNYGWFPLVSFYGVTFDDYNLDPPFAASFTRCTFENNVSENTTPLSIQGSYAAKITDCRFLSNRGGQGGAVQFYTQEWITTGSLSIHNSAFVNNRGAQGGALKLEGGTGIVTVANSVFVNNVADEGGAIRSSSTNLTVVNSTLVNNQAPLGGDIYHLYDGWSTPGSNLLVSNSILWGNATTSTGPRIAQSDQAGSVVLLHDLIEGYPGLTSTPDASGNFTADPLFARNPLTNGPDDAGDLRLLPASPAINAGSNALLLADAHDVDNDGDTDEPLPLDFALTPRISANTVDLGAFEYQNQTPIANGQDLTTNQDTPLGITLTASDSDGETLTYIIGQPAHGTLSGTAPNLTYTPGADYVGGDSFTFRVTDPFGVSSNTATISITVKDTTAPVITLNGSNPMSINQGSAFTDPGASATDNVDGAVPVTVSGNVNTAVPGSCTLTYVATDAAGNRASKTRTVNVIAVATPKITVTALGIARVGSLVGVVARVTNAGTTVATNVRINSASLIGVGAFLMAPGDSFRLNPGKSQEVLLTFYPLNKGQQGTLSLNGNSSFGAFGLNQTVTIP